MAAEGNSVWAIDIGSNCLKALRLREVSGVVEVIGFDNIQHGKILSGGSVTAAETEELIALSLRRFVSQNELDKDDVIVSVPSQNSLARFVNLPPVDKKRIPEIVKFEAAQQIPFDINDVQWDWQMMDALAGAEDRVGIFAIKNEIVSTALGHFGRENIQVSYVQMAPMALYNYLLYDRPDLCGSDNQATVIIDIGAENTDLVVCTKSTVWQRCIPVGGNAFTRAVADTFKLSFSKAEKLKRTATMSKYARQIFQSMKPVFTDFASEIQRSLGFYSSSNPKTKLTRGVAFGGGAKMRGLLKYIQQSLQIPIEMPDSFRRLPINSSLSAAKFHENVSDFGVVYGLALQGLGLAKIESNLLPRNIARSMAWKAKTKYFVAAASLLLVVSALCFARMLLDKANYSKSEHIQAEISRVISVAEQAGARLKSEQSKASDYDQMIQKAFEPFKYRDVIARLHQIILSALPNENNNPAQNKLYRAFADRDVETVSETERSLRKQIFVTSMSVHFVDDIDAAGLGQSGLSKGWRTSKPVSSKRGFMPGKPGKPGFPSMPGMPGMPGGGRRGRPKTRIRSKTRRSSSKRDKSRARDSEAMDKKTGFVVTIAGYSPYQPVGELMDPVGVGDDKAKWGFITRLEHLDELVSGGSPFELYKRTEIEHFKLERGKVSADSEMPEGIGIEQEIEKDSERKAERTPDGKQILIDPMTKEVISEVAELDEYGRKKFDRTGKVIYKVNDHWFVLKAKFVWKDAPIKN